MKRGEIYLVKKSLKRDPKNQRAFVVVSRQALIDSSFSTVICAPIYSRADGLSTQVDVGVKQGLKHHSSVFCDELVSIDKNQLRHFIGTLSFSQLMKLDFALQVALDTLH